MQDLQQLFGYMYDKHFIWGILTNGREYYLLNEMITTPKKSGNEMDVYNSVVLCINVSKSRPQY